MFECKICGVKLVKCMNHAFYKHGINTFEYLRDYEKYDILKIYQEDPIISSLTIAKQIKEKNIGISPSKMMILVYLKKNGVDTSKKKSNGR